MTFDFSKYICGITGLQCSGCSLFCEHRRRGTSEQELKPCPFCGGKATIRIFRGKDGWRDRYAVLCRYDEGGCGAESGLYHYEEEAIEAWNRRVTE